MLNKNKTVITLFLILVLHIKPNQNDSHNKSNALLTS